MTKSNPIVSRLCVGLVALAAVAAAQAQSSATTTSSGYTLYGAGSSYIGLNVGEADYAVNNGTGLFGSEKRDTSYNVYAGSFFNQNFGFEMGYTDFGKINRGGGNTKADGINLSLVGRLPLGSSFNLLGKLGTTYGRTDVSSALGSGIEAGSENGFGWSYGVGAEFAFHPQWSAVLQYDAHDLKYVGSGRDRVSTTSLGMRYRF